MSKPAVRTVGRYRLYQDFAFGGMASIHWGRLAGEEGFSRLVAIKRLHPQFAKDSEFVNMFVDEARVSGRIQHPNVVGVLDVVREDGELFLVMDYVHGEALSKLLKLARARDAKIPPPIVARFAVDMLQGLHAAHEARGEGGEPLEIVHRDVSPQNLLIGIDGIARVVDFGIAKARGRLQHTAEGDIKGKLSYFAPEQLKGEADRRTDVFAAAVVLWEAMMLRRLYDGDDQWEIANSIVHQTFQDPSSVERAIPEQLGAAVMRGLERDRDRRFQTAREMFVAVEKALQPASSTEVAEWVQRLAGSELDQKRAMIAASQELDDVVPPPSMRAPAPAGERGEEAIATTIEPAPERARTRPASVATHAPPPIAAGSSRWLKAAAVLGVALGLGGVAFGVWRRTAAPNAPGAPANATSAGQGPSAEVPTTLASVLGVAASVSSLAAPSASVVIAARRPPPALTAEPCAPNQTRCSSGCTMTRFDVKNCGRCGNVCPGENAHCNLGGCRNCNAPRTFCAAGGCVDPRYDIMNCGRCGNICSKRGFRMCQEGECIH